MERVRFRCAFLAAFRWVNCSGVRWGFWPQAGHCSAFSLMGWPQWGQGFKAMFSVLLFRVELFQV